MAPFYDEQKNPVPQSKDPRTAGLPGLVVVASLSGVA